MSTVPLLKAPRTLAEELLAGYARRFADTTFELESHGGYARIVSGAVEYLDREAETLIVRTPAGELIRVPIRDVISAEPSDGDDEQRFRPDSEGLGSGDVALRGWHPARAGPA